MGWAWLGLLGFPIGTMTSIPILIYLYRPQIKTVFAGKALDQLSSEEIKTLGSLSKLRLSLAVPITFGFLLWHSLLPAIFIPNMVNAIQRGKQTRTVAEIRSIAAAIEDYTTDHKSYPEAHTLSELRSVLVPQYLRFMPKKDGWGHPLRVRSTPREYTIQAAVMDGVFEERPSGGPTTDFDRDIVFSNGAFVQWPEGPQK